MDKDNGKDEIASISTESKVRSSTKDKRKTNPVKRCRNRSTTEKKNEKNQIPIFTDAFLELFRKQKSEIRSLKLKHNELTERFKLKDAQQEQIRLDNQKMRLDIEEISQKNYCLRSQVHQIQQQFKDTFQQEINKDFLLLLRENHADQEFRNKIQKIVQILQL